MSVTTINPATGATIAEYALDDAAAVERLLDRSSRGFRAWRDTGIEGRADVLSKLAALLRQDRDRLARLITTEMGKTIVEAEDEIEKCAHLAEWMAAHGPAYLADEKALVEEADAYVSFHPLGTILAVMPWNFPFWQVMRAAIPVTLSGNAFLLKHAPNVLGSAYAIQELFERAGAPDGTLLSINADVDVIDGLVKDDRIAAVSLTGSVRAGAAVASAASAAAKRSLLELGGSDPFIVLSDADLDGAVANAIAGRFGNAGQVCLAAKRIILEQSIAAEFTDRFVTAARALPVGDPMDRQTKLGPIARSDLRDGLHKQVEATRSEGARCLLGGAAIHGDGFFYQTTVFDCVEPGMTAFKEETFGPVAAIIVAADADEAVALANDSDFGLGGALWTADLDRAKSLARRLETGGVFVNGHTKSDPRVPVGGIKQSGYGRELSHFGLREFTNAQTVWIPRP